LRAGRIDHVQPLLFTRRRGVRRGLSVG
jgi:hypothetical protein